MNKKYFSKLGISLVSLYWLFAIGVFIYAKTCSGMFCGLAIVLPVMPWPIIEFTDRLMKDTLVTYIVLLVVNSLIFYSFGLLGSKVFDKIHQSK